MSPPLKLSTFLRRLGPAGPLAVVAATLPPLGGFALLWQLNAVGPWLKSHDAVGVLLYIAGFTVFAGLALLPTYAQAILGGWAFGFALGLPAALSGFLGAALLAYGLARRATGRRVVQLIEEKPKWQAVYAALLQSGFWRALMIVTLLRLPLNSPFAITNLVMAATRVPPLAFGLGTLLGMAPRTAAAVFIAARLQELTFEGTQTRWMWVASLVATLAALIVIGHIANRAVTRVTVASTRTPATAPETTAP